MYYLATMGIKPLEENWVLTLLSLLSATIPIVIIFVKIIMFYKNKYRDDGETVLNIKAEFISLIIAIIIIGSIYIYENNKYNNVDDSTSTSDTATMNKESSIPSTDENLNDIVSESISGSESASVSVSVSESAKTSIEADESRVEAERELLYNKEVEERNKYLNSNAKFVLKEQEKSDSNLFDKGRIVKEFSGSLASYDDVKEYSFTLKDKAPVWISFEHDNLTDENIGWSIRMVTSDGTEAFNFESYGNKPKTVDPIIYGASKGKYTIYVSRSRNYTDAKYELKIYCINNVNYETENNNGVLNADSIKLTTNTENNTMFGNLTNRDDLDFYKFTLPDDGHIAFKFEHENLTDDGEGWLIELWNYQSEIIYRITSNLNQPYVYSPNIGLKADTYYIKVIRSGSYSNKAYALTVSYCIGNNWGTEVQNDYISSSKEIVSSSIYYDSLINRDDIDYFSFSCVESGSYSISFEHDLEDSEGYGWEIFVLDELSEPITEKSLISEWNQKNVRMNFYLEENKVYYFKVSRYGDHSKYDYSLIIKKE